MSSNDSTPSRHRRRRLLAAVGLVLLYAVPAAISLRWDAITFDETSHLPAGWTNLARGDFRINPQHPPLAKMIGALPLLAEEVTAPSGDDPRWIRGDEWGFGHRVMIGLEDPHDALLPCRLVMLLFGVLLISCVQRLGREMFGEPAGWIAAGLAALSPTVLAHARLVNTDVPGAATCALALLLLWRWLERPDLRRAVLLSAGVTVAVLTKFSGLLLLPLVVGGFVRAMLRSPRRRGPRLGPGPAIGQLLLGVAGFFLMVWAVYGFRYAPTPDGVHRLDWAEEAAAPDWIETPLRFASEARLLPEAFLFGIVRTADDASQRDAFLAGELSRTGWWEYFPLAFVWKTPAGLLILLATALVALVSGRLPRGPAGLLLGWIALIFGVAMAGNLAIGQRHLLPAYPALFVLAGGAADRLRRHGAGRLVAAAALLAVIVASATAFPRYLGWFSLLGGGRETGWTRLVDSNCDWGQDLLRLREWIEVQEVDPPWLAWFGTGDPQRHGVPHRKFLSFLNLRPEEPGGLPSPGSLLAVSVTLLQGVYVPPALQPWMRRLREEARPLARVGDSIFVYRVP